MDPILKDKFTEKGRGMSINSCIVRMLKENREDEFIVSFLMVVLGSYLVAGTNLTVQRQYLDAISDVKKIKDLNWCDHVTDYLFGGINLFRSNTKKNVNIKGCVHILNVIFTDFAASINTPQGTPRVAHVTNVHFDALKVLATNQTSKDPQYHSIQIKNIEDTVYHDGGTLLGETKESESIAGAQGNMPNCQVEHTQAHESKECESVAGVQTNMKDFQKDHSQEEHVPDSGHNAERLNMKNKQGEPYHDLPPAFNELLSNLNEKLKRRRVQIINTCMEQLEVLLDNSDKEILSDFYSEIKVASAKGTASTSQGGGAGPCDASNSHFQGGVEGVGKSGVQSIVEDFNTTIQFTEIAAMGVAAVIDSSRNFHGTDRVDEEGITTSVDNFVDVGGARDENNEDGVDGEDGDDGNVDGEDGEDENGNGDDESENDSLGGNPNDASDKKDSAQSEDNADLNDGSDGNQNKEQSTPIKEQFPGASMMDSMTADTSTNTPRPVDAIESPLAQMQVPQLTEPIPNGERFPDAGSVPTATKHRPKRHKANLQTVEAIAALGKGLQPGDFITKCYHKHVLATQIGDGHDTKVSIKGAYVTQDEFRSPLVRNGEINNSFMWLCCKAIMADWDTKSKVILDPSTVRELTQPLEKCNDDRVRRTFSFLNMEELDRLYLPILKDHHWFLLIINLRDRTAQIFDSLNNSKESKKSYSAMWEDVKSNLQVALDTRTNKPFGFGLFKIQYPVSPAQDGLHDCGFCVLRMLECHNGRSPVGYHTKGILQYRAMICHRLLYHRFNDLHPARVL
uniref:Ubiquitin-like protease family profile domain-containing protein n=1 Tax=Oryza punctata TaxID=4537 RepID=A0A0E0LXB1_ORYPU